MLDKIKEVIEDIKETIDWVLAGCPKPSLIPVREDGREKQAPKDR